MLVINNMDMERIAAQLENPLPFKEPPEPIRLALATPLSALKTIEAQISRLEMKFVEEGELLERIRSEKLYVEAGFKSFAAYTKATWGLSTKVVSNYIRAGRVVRILQEAGYTDLPSSHSLYLFWACLDAEEIAVLWEQYLEQHPVPRQHTAAAFIKEYKATHIPPKPKTKSTIAVPCHTADQLTALAEAKGVSKADIIKRLIDKLFAD